MVKRHPVRVVTRVRISVQHQRLNPRSASAVEYPVVEISPFEYVDLAQEEREELATAAVVNGAADLWLPSTDDGQPLGPVSVSESGFAGVRATLAARLAKRAEREGYLRAEQAARALRRREAIEAALVAPVEELIDLASDRPLREAISGTAIDWDAPELRSKRVEVTAEITRQRAALEIARKREAARLAAAVAERKRREEEARAELLAFALEGKAGRATQRSAQAGYSTDAAVLQAVIDQLPRPDRACNSEDGFRYEAKESPTQAAFDLLDRITEAIERVSLKPACVTLELSRIARIYEPDDYYTGRKGPQHTGVRVTLRTPITRDIFLNYYVPAALDGGGERLLEVEAT